jgi:hypothetical protein
MSDYTLTDLDTGEMIELTERQHTYFIRSARRETQKLNLALDSNANFLAENTKLLLEKSKLQKAISEHKEFFERIEEMHHNHHKLWAALEENK